MIKKLWQMALDEELGARERMFRVILLVGGMMAVLGTAESLWLINAGIVAVPLLCLMVMMVIVMFTTFRYRRVDFAAIIVAIMLVAVIFPAMFFLDGGIEGGSTVWFVLGIFYVFMMFSGKRLVFFLPLTICIDIGCYLAAYYFPDMIMEMETREAMYVDSLFGVLVVGVGVGILLKFQMHIFDVERKLTLAQKEELERTSDSRSQFFANMSHEIRTPINTIIGLNEMILRESQEKDTRAYAENIQSASRVLLNLVNDILDLSRMEIQKMEIVPEEYETAVFFEEIIDMMQVRMKEKGLEFYVDIDMDIPAVLYGDEKRLQQVLLNILSNAVKYTREGSVTLTVQAEPAGRNEIRMKISVADTGIGIRKRDLEHLYETFRRVDERNNAQVEGSGLGLSIAKQLVELMGGELTVDSIYTKGSTFTVTLNQRVINPLHIGNQKFLEKTKKSSVSDYEQSFEAPEARILVVDDNEMNSMVVCGLLGPTRVQIDTAASGTECLEKTRQKYYHIILMDYMMPGMDGAETLKELRRQENGLCRESPVLLLTANVLSGARQMCDDFGFNGYLEKPIQAAKLEEEILRFLPDDIVEYRMSQMEDWSDGNTVKQVFGHRRKKNYITADCVCDLPEDMLEKYDIRLMNFYIRTDKARFVDTREIDSDNLERYLTEPNNGVRSECASVEEYEEFFGEVLAEADHVIHISMAAYVGDGYERAQMAARGFDHVHVIDSGQISGGAGLIVLYAAKLAASGYHTKEICEQVEKMKNCIRNRVIMPSVRHLYQNNRTSAMVARLCEMFHLHPVLTLRQSRVRVIGARRGQLEGAWKRHIRSHLMRKWRIGKDVVFITYAGCSVEQLEMARAEILKQIPFEKVILQKASFSNACNVGLGAIGIAYYAGVE